MKVGASDDREKTLDDYLINDHAVLYLVNFVYALIFCRRRAG